MPRPPDLPEFTSPPLTEVYLSVQFGTSAGWREIFAREVWSLFEKDFPNVEEQPPLPPVFEVFGAQGAPALRVNLQPLVGPLHTRYWFLSATGSELIQFQSDRFLHNWRKIVAPGSDYPRFDAILAKFKSELVALEAFYQQKGFGPLVPNQCELAYLNQMPLTDERGQPLAASFYFRTLDLTLAGEPAEFSLRLRQRIAGEPARPAGRLHIEANTVTGEADKPALALNLTVRGTPPKPTIPGAIQFLDEARGRIVRTFAAITSDAAHQEWGRTQ